jgi:hypothetical protein
MTTATLYDFASKHNEWLEVQDEDYIPQKGEIFLWKNQDGGMGHTGVVVDYNEATDEVTTIEALNEDSYASSGHDGYDISGVVKWTWKRTGFHLIGHHGSPTKHVTANRFYTPRVHYSKAPNK